ncbi:MAG: hypothetical protein JNJ83_06060 [Verrucomicrobiaceae bacterium]|nr:hypothetical protein [Verrucomicrobiaceae bacterium]
MKARIALALFAVSISTIQCLSQVGRSDTSSLPDKVEVRQAKPRGTNTPPRSVVHHVVGGRVVLECLTYRSEDGSQILRRAYTVFDPMAEVDEAGIPKPPIMPVLSIFEMVSPEARLSSYTQNLPAGWVLRTVDADKHGPRQWALSKGGKVVLALMQDASGEIRPMTKAEYDAQIAARIVPGS